MAIRRAIDGDVMSPRLVLPRGAKGRVVSCDVPLQSGGVPSYAVTEPVGQDCWLVSVRLWFFPSQGDVSAYREFRVLTGMTEVNSAAEILNWDEVLPKLSTAGRLTAWRVHEGGGAREWTMTRLYVGAERRFGIWGQKVGDWADWIWASFEVIEGL